MPDPNLGQVAATAWEHVVGKKPTDNIFNSNALFNALGDDGFKEQADGGRLIEMPLMYAENSTFRSYGELEQLDTTRIDVFDAARFDWKILAGTVTFSDLEKLRVAGSSGKIDLIEEKLQNGRDSHVADINRQCYGDGTGNGGKNIGGLALLIPDVPTSGTVGGINRATHTWWRSIANAGTKTSTAFDNLQSSWTTVYNTCSKGGVQDAPTAVITARAIFQGFEGTLTTLERYNKDGKGQRGATARFDNDALMFKAAKVMYDEDCSPSDNAFFLNPKFLKFKYLKGGWMKMKPELEPVNQLASIARVATFGNLAINNSRRLGVSYDIT